MDGFLQWLFVSAPFWLIAVSVFVLLGVSYFLGAIVRRNVVKTMSSADDGESLSVTSVLGLLALLLGFTFSLALDRYDRRRELVRDEAVAIRTAYFRAGTFPAPYGSEIRRLLHGYVATRIALGEARDERRLKQLSDTSDGQQQLLWLATERALIDRRDDISSSFMDSLNSAFEVDAARRLARQARIPHRVLGALLFYMAVSSALVGYELGNRRRGEALVMLALTTTAYLLIIDIDDALRGGVQESQSAMIELKAYLGKVDAAAGPR